MSAWVLARMSCLNELTVDDAKVDRAGVLAGETTAEEGVEPEGVNEPHDGDVSGEVGNW